MTAAAGFRLYGWACLCFVLGCLPGARQEHLRPSDPHSVLGWVSGLLALALVSCGLWGLYHFEQYMLGFLPLLAGLALLGIAYPCLVENVIAQRKAQRRQAEQETLSLGDPYRLRQEDRPAPAELPPWRRWAPHTLVLAGVAFAAGAFFLWWGRENQALPFLPLVYGMLLSGIGVYLLDRRRGVRFWGPDDIFDLWEIPFLGVILALAIYLRFWQLDRIPEGIWFDEAQFAMEARRILTGAPYSPMTAYSFNPSFPVYLNAAFLYLLGDTLWALRCVVATAGVVSVVGMYLLGRELFGRWAGLVAALMLASSYWHVNFSRFNMPNVMAPACAIWMFYFLFRGINNRRWLDFALSGFVLGLGLHTYTGFRVVPLILVPWFILAAIFHKEFLRKYLCSCLLLGVFALAAFLPLGAYALKHPKEFTARTSETSVFRPGLTWGQQRANLGKNCVEHYQMFHYRGDRNPRHGLSGAPKVDFACGVLMFLGLALACYRWRDPRYFLLPVWLAISLLAGILSLEFESPQTARTVTAIPVAFLLAARAIDEVRRLLARALPGTGRYLFGMALIPLLAYIAQTNFDIYFRQQMKRSDTWTEFSGRDTAVARFLQTFGLSDVVYTQNDLTWQTLYLIPQPPYENRHFVAFQDLPPVDVVSDGARVVYVLEHWRMPLPELYWKHYFPEGAYKSHASPYGEPIFFTVTLPGRTINRARGIRVQSGKPSGVPWEFSFPRFLITPEAWREQEGPDLPAPVHIEALLYVPNTGSYSFELAGGFEGRVSVNDVPVMPAASPPVLVQGWNQLVVEGVWQGQEALHLRWQPPAAEAFRPVADNYLYHLAPSPFGLLGYYYPNPEWEGPPAHRQTDPQTSFHWQPEPFEQPWSARWQGWLHAPVSGEYRLSVKSNDWARVFVNDRLIVDQRQRSEQDALLELSEGRHALRVEYRQASRFAQLRLCWTVPGQSEQVIPSWALTPARR